jgi:hypothetical protein
MREEMLEAVTGRKKSTLPIALEIFRNFVTRKYLHFPLKKMHNQLVTNLLKI